MSIKSRKHILSFFLLIRNFPYVRERVVRVPHNATPYLVHLSISVRPRGERALHVSIKEILDGFNEDAVVDVVVPVFLERTELFGCATDDDGAVGAGDQVAHCVVVCGADDVGVCEARARGGGVGDVDTGAYSFAGDYGAGVLREERGDVGVGCVDDLGGVDGAAFGGDVVAWGVWRGSDGGDGGVGLEVYLIGIQEGFG